MTRFDHFHATYTLPDGSTEELEGGWTGYPQEYLHWTPEERRAWVKSFLIDWGMPKDASLKRFSLGG